MSIKVKILNENKKQKIDEAVLDMLSDPTMLALGVGGLTMLYKMFFGSEPDLGSPESLERARQAVKKKVAKANAGQEEYAAKMSAERARLKAKLGNLKKQKSLNLPPPEDAKAIPMVDDGATDEAPSVEIPDAVVRRFVRAKRLADDPRTAKGDAANAQRKVDKMREEYPGIDNHPDLGLYEAFIRFL